MKDQKTKNDEELTKIKQQLRDERKVDSDTMQNERLEYKKSMNRFKEEN